MRNNKERQEFVRNEDNWEVIDRMAFAVLKKLEYKGAAWLKIQHYVEGEKYDYTVRDRKVVKEYDDKGVYIVNGDGDALKWSNETEIVDKMRELDRLEKKGKKNND